jgi:hypothetical protein
MMRTMQPSAACATHLSMSWMKPRQQRASSCSWVCALASSQAATAVQLQQQYQQCSGSSTSSWRYCWSDCRLSDGEGMCWKAVGPAQQL